MNKISRSKKFIASNPSFRVLTAARPPKLQHGQRTIIFDCLSAVYPNCISLTEMVKVCCHNPRRPYPTKTEKNMSRSILHHLNLMESVKQCSN